MKYLLRMLREVFRCAPGHAIYGICQALMSAAEQVLSVSLLPRFFLNAMTEGRPWGDVVVVVCAVGALMLLSYLADHLQKGYVEPAMRARLFERMQRPIMEQSLRLDMQQYDNTDFYNDYRWASTEADKRAMEIYATVRRMVEQCFMVGGFLAVVLTLDPFVAVIASGYYVSSYLLNMRMAKINLERSEAFNQPKRRIEYFERVFAGPEYAKDLRMTDLEKPLLARLRDNTREMLELHDKFGKRCLRVKTMLNLADAGFVDVGMYGYLAYALLVRGNITVGDFMALSSAAEGTLWKVRTIVNLVTACAEHAMYAEKYYKFLDAEPEMVNRDGRPAGAGDLVLSGVKFTYPGTEKPILSGFDLTIRRGEKVAIVGRNGAGKTTLVKLLLRLYDPESGTITYGGTDVREYEQEAYRRQFGVLFQDFHIFAATLAQNVAMDTQYDPARVERALTAAGLPVTQDVFPQGLDTLISKQFGDDGTLLSGGQMQKVAIARALYADPAVLIFDEPSSALDPIAEYEFNRTLLSRTAGHTLIIIAHRLSTVRMMDRIILVDGERIAEEGSHSELMARGGLYAQMFEAQRRQYVDTGDERPDMETLFA